MKKIALILAIIMLVSTCGILVACNNEAALSVEDKISSEVKLALMAKIAAQNAIYGKSMSYSSHTISIETIKEGESYEVSGTLFITGGKSVRYSGEVEYDAASDDYDSDIDVDF